MSVPVSAGGNDANLEVAGFTVAKIRKDFGEGLGIQAGDRAMVNGKAVSEDYILRDGQKLNFVGATAEKGLVITITVR